MTMPRIAAMALIFFVIVYKLAAQAAHAPAQEALEPLSLEVQSFIEDVADEAIRQTGRSQKATEQKRPDPIADVIRAYEEQRRKADQRDKTQQAPAAPAESVPSEGPQPPVAAEEPKTGEKDQAEKGSSRQAGALTNVPLPRPRPKQPQLRSPEHPIAVWDKRKQAQRWTKFVLTALDKEGKDLLANTPRDVREWCAGYSKLDMRGKKAFWVALVSTMAAHESSFKPNAYHQEKFNDSSGSPVVSRGLLQLSVESSRAVGCSNIEVYQDLYDPETNLTCGVRMLNRYIGKDSRIFGRNVTVQGKVVKWAGASRYWGIYRLQRMNTEMRKVTRRLWFCKA